MVTRWTRNLFRASCNCVKYRKKYARLSEESLESKVCPSGGLNMAPVNMVPLPQLTYENSALVFSSIQDNPISVHDEDAGSGAIRVTLTASNGTASLKGTTGLTFSSGDGTHDSTMEFVGTICDINAALTGMVFSPTPGYMRSASLEILTDDQGNTGSGGSLIEDDTIDITVASAFIILGTGEQNNVAGESISFPIQFACAPGHNPSFQADGLPPGLAIDSASGVIFGTITATAASSSPYSVTITATDNLSNVIVAAAMDWNVATPEVKLYLPGDIHSVVGADVALLMAGWDSSGAVLAYSASGLPAGLTIDGETGEITGTIDSNADINSPYAVTVTATNDAADVSASVSFTWHVRHLVLGGIYAQANVVGETVTLDLEFDYPGNWTLQFEVNGLPDGLTYNSSTGQILGILAPNSHASVPYSVMVTVTDGSLTETRSFSWEVKKVVMEDLGAVYSNDGDEVSVAIGFRQIPGNNIVFSANGLPTGLNINNAGQITGVLGEDAHTNGPYTVAVTLNDTDANVSVTKSFTWFVDSRFTLPEEEQLPDPDPYVPFDMTVQERLGGQSGIRRYLLREYDHAIAERARSQRMVESLGRGVDFFWAEMNRIAAANPNNYLTRADYIQAATLYDRGALGARAWRQRYEHLDKYIWQLLIPSLEHYGITFC